MLGTSPPDDGLVIQSTQWSMIWVGNKYTSDLTQDNSPSHSIWITTFLAFIKISAKSSSNGTPTVEIKVTDIYGSQAPFMLPILPWIVEPPINLIGGIFNIETGLYTSILYFANRTTESWSAPSLKFFWVCLQGQFYWWIFHIIVLPQLCGFLVLRQNTTLLHHHWWPVPYQKLVLQKNRFATCVPHEVHYLLIQRIFAVHCNMKIPRAMPPTNTF